MNEVEARRVVKLMARVHGYDVDAELFEIWYESALEGIDYELGLRVAKKLNQDCAWMPKPAQFNEQVRLASRGNDPSHMLGLPAAPSDDGATSPEQAKQNLAELRTSLNSLAAKWQAS